MKKERLPKQLYTVMKKISIIILALIPNLIFSQSNLSTTIEFANQITFSEKKDSLQFAKMIEKGVQEFITFPEKQIFYLKRDSILVESFPNKNGPSNNILIRTNKSIEKLDISSGNKMKWVHPLVISKYRKFKNYKRISKEDKNILGYDCKAFIVTSRFGWHKIWISNIKLNNVGIVSPDILVDGNLILKRVTFKNDGIQEDSEAISFINSESDNLGKLIEEHLIHDIKDKYLPIPENIQFSNKPIKKGALVDNYKFRNVLKDGIINLHEVTSLKEFTLLEFWGTWCIPCLLANEKIQELKKLCGDEKLSIISINAKDRNIGKLKKVIEKKRMNWKHGYATEKILGVFNNNGTYPKLVILNKKNKVLFIGNPNVDYAKIKSIINIDDCP